MLHSPLHILHKIHTFPLHYQGSFTSSSVITARYLSIADRPDAMLNNKQDTNLNSEMSAFRNQWETNSHFRYIPQNLIILQARNNWVDKGLHNHIDLGVKTEGFSLIMLQNWLTQHCYGTVISSCELPPGLLLDTIACWDQPRFISACRRQETTVVIK